MLWKVNGNSAILILLPHKWLQLFVVVVVVCLFVLIHPFYSLCWIHCTLCAFLELVPKCGGVLARYINYYCSLLLLTICFYVVFFLKHFFISRPTQRIFNPFTTVTAVRRFEVSPQVNSCLFLSALPHSNTVAQEVSYLASQ